MTPTRLLNILRLRIRSLTRRSRADDELSRELLFHIDQETKEYVARGMPPDEARRAAIRRLGAVTQIQEECRDMRRVQYLENFRQDFRYGVRNLSKTPGFTVAVILTLALSIGANTAIFSVIQGVLLKPLPYLEPARIVRIFYHNATYPRFPVNPYDFRDFRSGARSFESIAAYTHSDLQLSGINQPMRLSGFRVTTGFFHVLGLRPARGREFGQGDELPDHGRVVILSDHVWRNHFASDENIIGRKILLDSVPFEVVGVMPPGTNHPGNSYNPVAFGETVDAWTPFVFSGNPARRGAHFIEAIARLKSGVTPLQAESELNALMVELGERYNAEKGWTINAVPLYDEVVGGSRRMLLVLFGAVGLVLLIACVNAANLLLARATTRQREIAVRTALGAGRGRLIRQTLTESLFLALASGLVGAAMAAGGTQLLVSLLPAGFPRGSTVSMDVVVFGFTVVIALTTGLLFGIIPALQISRFNVQHNLREGGRGTSASGRQARLRAVLVISEVALACVLLIGAGLILRSFVNLLRMDPGFRSAQVVTATVALPGENYKGQDAISRFFDRALLEWKGLPGVEIVGVGSDLPWTGYDDNLGGMRYEDRPVDPDAHARYHVASQNYFRALGIPLLAGRFFDDRDTTQSTKVMIINQAMARRYWPNENVIGKRIGFGPENDPGWTTIVGVVGDIKDQPNSSGAEPAFWWPVDQMLFSFPKMSVVMRGAPEPALLANQLREAVQRLDSSLAVADVQVMNEVADRSFSTPRFVLFLVALFAGLALTLAMTGIHGVISYAVGQRMHEFGMRIALGASRWDIMRLVLKDGMTLAAIGVAAGLLGAAAISSFLGTLLYEVKHLDPITFLGVGVIAIAVAVIACYVPARRATVADPMKALRTD